MLITHYKKLISCFILCILCFICASAPVFAQTQPGLGGVATSLMDPVTVASDFINSACLIIGGAFLFASIIKFIEHRRNPTMVPLSTVIFLLVAGLLLLALPLLSFVTEGGIPFTILNKKP